jgi:hypothetical protein
MQLIRAAAMAMLIAITTIGSSQAVVVYRFETTSLTNLIYVIGEARFTDAAFAAGATSGVINEVGGFEPGGLLSFFLDMSVPFQVAFDVNAPQPSAVLSFDFVLGLTLTGSFHAGESGPYQITGVDGLIGYGTDDNASVCFGGVGEFCSATGVWRLVEVPEPSALVLMMGAAGALGGLSSRRRINR